MNTNKHAKKDYYILKEVLIKLYGGVKKPSKIYAKEFLELSQNSMNLYVYYAKLVSLAKKAYPTLEDNIRKKLIDDKFICSTCCSIN